MALSSMQWSGGESPIGLARMRGMKSPLCVLDITCNNLKKYTSVASRNKIGYVSNTITKREHHVRETLLYDEGHIENT